MRKGITVIYLMLVSAIMLACATPQPPAVVNGAFPKQKPRFDVYHNAGALPKAKTSLLIGATAQDQADIYIIEIDGKARQKKGLIGGSKAAIVLPGKHEVVVQLRDKGRITMPLKLGQLNLKAGTGYLINFTIRYPEAYRYPAGNDAIRIKISVHNLDSKKMIYTQMFNGWGKSV